ncbi:MAG: alpha/beta hydrolase [Lachnospiraceae bacterium]|nr:alpha/beta hydrolase [Lachnospiraceae bacterium]
MINLKPDQDINVAKRVIYAKGHKIPLLVLSPKTKKRNAPGVLWIHGGGYMLGMKEMVYMSRAVNLVKKYGAIVISPGYRLSFRAPYPAAIEDCYQALLYLKEHADELGVNANQLMVGGESAGGGLTAALCMMARDYGEVNIAYQMPLYPMIDNFDTESSKDNHAKVWNTRRNHLGWRLYLRKNAKKEVSPYAAPARQTDYTNLPPAYTFVGTAEPFYTETLEFVDHLHKAGVNVKVDVYPDMYHAFDMLEPKLPVSQEAIRRFEEQFEYAITHYFAEQA